tara:strand:- start:51 stop:512 length:462 start_codon:yes stop_codon:yes gene_type:complete
MSLKEWKNKELSKNLTNKWGFNMDLTKLNEAHCGGDHDKADESHCMEEELEELNLKKVDNVDDPEGGLYGVGEKGKEKGQPKFNPKAFLAKGERGKAYHKGTVDVEDPTMEEELEENLEEKEMSKKEKEFAALAEPKDKITYADKIAGAKKEK